MKKYMRIIWAVLLTAVLTACGSFQQIDLQDTVEIPENGLIEESVLALMQEEDAIGTFCGQSNGLDYEWTVFGSDISEPADTNFLVDVQASEEEVSLCLSTQKPFDFPALLSVTLDDLWQAQTATAYDADTPIASVSLTGTKQTVLNVSLDGAVQTVTIRPDPLPEDAMEMPAEQITTSVEMTVTPQPEVIEIVTSETASGTVTEQAPPEEDKTYTQVTIQTGTGTGGSGSSGSDSSTSDRTYSDGTQTGQDAYLTDPVPVGKPMPVEPENQEIDKSEKLTCTFSIECSTILNNLDQLDPDKLEMVPSGGTILATTTVTFSKGESVFDVLQRLCQEQGIHMENSWTPIYNSAYIEGIHNLYEFDCGALSGWMYRVNGWYPNYGCSRYQLADGDRVEWRYTCDLGHDVGGAYAVGGQSE